MTPEAIIDKIQQQIPDAEVFPSGADCNFSVEVISVAFAGKTPIQCHRMVNEALKAELASGELHALSIKTRVKV